MIMKNIVSVAFLILPILAWSQLLIESTDLGNEGDTVRVSNSEDFDLDYESTGVDYSWDFTSLTPVSQAMIEYSNVSDGGFLIASNFGSGASSEYQASYYQPSDALPLDQIGNILPVEITDVSEYSKLDTDSLTLLGLSLTVQGFNVPFKSDNIETKYKFPMTFGDQFTSYGYTDLNLSPAFEGRIQRMVNRTVDVDGWGLVETPFGSFQAIRVHHIIEERDSVQMEFNGFPINVEIPLPEKHVYEWWTNGQKEPVLRVEMRSLLGNSTVTSVQYRDKFDPNVLSVSNTELIDVSVYPNPTSEVLQVDGLDDATYRIVNLNGQVVLEGLVQNQEINVRNLQNGTYQIIFIQSNYLFVETFVKK